MTGAEFEAYVSGKTLFFLENGQPYGAEIYLPGRRVRWSFLDGQCTEGTWFEQDGLICFDYEDRSDLQCWSFRQTDAGLAATFAGGTDATVLYEAQDLGRDLLCPGPRVGV